MSKPSIVMAKSLLDLIAECSATTSEKLAIIHKLRDYQEAEYQREKHERDLAYKSEIARIDGMFRRLA